MGEHTKPSPYCETDKYITITVAEYHCLTKAAAMLEVIINDQTYDHTAVVNAAKAAIEAMQRQAEAGAAE